MRALGNSLFTVCMLLASCETDQIAEETEQLNSSSVHYQPNNAKRGNDTLLVDRKAAVLFNADSIKIEKMKKDISEDDFYTIADDYLYYLYLCRNFLDSVKIKRLDANGIQLLQFKGSNGSSVFVRTDTLPGLGCIYFFDPTKKPQQVDMINIESEYNSYFTLNKQE